MTQLRRFNDLGMGRFRELIHSAQQGQAVNTDDLLNDGALTEDLPGGILLEADGNSLQPHATRRQVAERLLDLLEPAEAIPGYLVARDRSLWSWLSALWLPALTTKRNGKVAYRHVERYIPVDDWRKYYRHLLLGPYLIGRAFRKDLDIVMSILATPVAEPGEVVAQLAASEEIAQSNTVQGAATALYFDKSTGRIRRGAAGKSEEGKGEARRLAALVNQLRLTWDLESMTPEEFLELLPTEFDRFRP